MGTWICPAGWKTHVAVGVIVGVRVGVLVGEAVAVGEGVSVSVGVGLDGMRVVVGMGVLGWNGVFVASGSDGRPEPAGIAGEQAARTRATR